MTAIAVVLYGSALVIANLLVAKFGPWISPLNAFFLIGFDLAMRDWLHLRISPARMLALIGLTGALTYALNPAAGVIAIASAVAFTASSAVDWATFLAMRGSWLRRANTSNVAGAAVDSLLFPTIAFGALMPHIVALQFAAKVAGGALWAWALSSSVLKDESPERAGG